MRIIRRNAFTLIELLVVIGIVCVIIALLLPAIQHVRAAALRASCANHIRQLALATLNYENDRGILPAQYTLDPATGAKTHSWPVYLFSYVEQSALASRYKFDVPYSDPANLPLLSTHIPTLLCPAAEPNRLATFNLPTHPMLNGVQFAQTDYSPFHDLEPALMLQELPAFVGDSRGPLNISASRRLVDISGADGTGTTMLFGEIAGLPSIWQRKQKSSQTLPGGWGFPDIVVNLDGCSFDGMTLVGPGGLNCTNHEELYSFHVGGVNIVYLDGHVQFLRDNAHISVVAAIVTANGKENLTPE